MRSHLSAQAHVLRPGGLRELARIAAEAAAVGLFASVALLLAALLIANAAEAATGESPTSGTLRFNDASGAIDAPLLHTDVEIGVSGIAARTRVSQRFMNPGSDWREGVYVFPLPENAAVDHLEMRIGSRRIEGQIRERAQARREYDQAKQQGRKAALVEQERPKLFTTSVAPIGPGEEIVVAIEYQQTLRYDDGRFSLRFPMAITPRYIPGSPAVATAEASEAAPGLGWGADTDRVPDASRITPPVAHPSLGKINPVTLKVALDAGFPLARIESPYHTIKIDESADHRYGVSIEGVVPADRDFELVWTPEIGRSPGAAVFIERGTDASHLLMMLVPSSGPDPNLPRTPREVTFVIDTSGSMAGSSIVQAKAALAMALERLAPGDRFNIVEFNSSARALFAAPMPVDPATLGRARSFVSGLRADGGTEMREALLLALGSERAEGYVRQVVFLTDGAVGNEQELFALIRNRLGDRRLFTVGIGSAPNSHFMTKAAQFGRGTFTYIGDVREVQEKMAALYRKLESPVLTDIELAWPGAHESYPATVPDLYAGEPIVVTAALRSLDGELVVRGRHAGKLWQAKLPLADNGEAHGIGVLWARAKIDGLEDARIAGANPDDIRSEIVRVALAHHLVSKYTSLVAVDVTATAPPGVDLKSSAMPGNLPEGQAFEKIFGGLPQTATSAPRAVAIAIGAMLAAMLLWIYGRGGARAGSSAAVLVAATLALQSPQANARDDAMLLVPGHYDGDIGSFDLGAADRALATLPGDRWFVLDTRGKPARLEPARMHGTRPEFLAMLERSTDDAWLDDERGTYWLRMPSVELVAGPVEEVPLRRRALVPKLDHRYTLALGATSFAMTARNGRGGRDGAYYVMEVGNERYKYLLPGYGFEHEIVFAGDIDRDAKPDLIIYVSAGSSGAYYLLLSSQARPGMNVPTATLWHSGGC